MSDIVATMCVVLQTKEGLVSAREFIVENELEIDREHIVSTGTLLQVHGDVNTINSFYSNVQKWNRKSTWERIKGLFLK